MTKSLFVGNNISSTEIKALNCHKASTYYFLKMYYLCLITFAIVAVLGCLLYVI